MLKVATVGKDDIVYDLGSGDGRIVITAAKEYGARGVGIDIDPERVAEATANAQQAGVSHLVRFLSQDLFRTNLSEATVVTIYLLPGLNLKLRPKLLAELKPGTRVVSHAFDMGNWVPDKTLEVDGERIYFWTFPAGASECLTHSVECDTNFGDRQCRAPSIPWHRGRRVIEWSCPAIQ